MDVSFFIMPIPHSVLIPPNIGEYWAIMNSGSMAILITNILVKYE